MLALNTWWQQTPAGTKLLIAGIVVLAIAVCALLVSENLGPDMEPLLAGRLSASERQNIVAYLQSQDVPYRIHGGVIEVPAEQRPQLLAAMRVRSLIPAEESTSGFAKLTTHKPAWYLSNEQNRQLYNLALQDELSRVVSSYPAVRRATVIISHPQGLGFAATHRRPSASVNVEMASGMLDPRTVEAIAGLVSGAVAEMEPQDVAVIDATAGRQYTARASGDLAMTGEAHELKQGIEQACREKIIQTLSYIEGVIVAVNAEVDVVRRKMASDLVDPEHTLELRTAEQIDTLQESTSRGEQSALTSQRVARQFAPALSRRQETAVDPGGLPTRISATVNVPRSFFVAAYRRATGPRATEPSDADLLPFIDTQLARIRRQVEPLVLSREPGQVVVDVYPDSAGAAPEAAPALLSAPAAAEQPFASLLDVPWPVAAMIGLLASVLIVARAARPRRSPAPPAAAAGGPPVNRASERLINSIRDEHPQTIAVCLSRLPQDMAAEVLASLPDELTAEVLDRMTRMTDVESDILRDVDDYLAIRTAEEAPTDPDQLEHLDDATVRAVVEEVGGETLVAALRVAGPVFRERVMRHMPDSEGQRLRRSLEEPIPVCVSDIEAAQRRVLEIAARYQSVEGLAA